MNINLQLTSSQVNFINRESQWGKGWSRKYVRVREDTMMDVFEATGENG